jgi:hypothetical protein
VWRCEHKRNQNEKQGAHDAAGKDGKIRQENTDNESVCGDFPQPSIPLEQMQAAVLPAGATAKRRLGQRSVLFRHMVNRKLMQKVHRLTDN